MRLFSSKPFLLAFLVSSLLGATLMSSILAPDARAEETLQNVNLDTTDAIDQFLLAENHLIIEASGENHPFTVELALDSASRSKGLMYRTKMATDHGMLFDFGTIAPVYMWMKNTYISLDMLFIKDDGTIVHMAKHTTPLSESIIGSGEPVRYVLELTSGTVDRLGLKTGDRIRHQLFTP